MFISFQSLTDDVARQTEREKQLQARYAALQDEVNSMRVGKVENGHMNGHAAVDSAEEDKAVEEREEEGLDGREEMEVDG